MMLLGNFSSKVIFTLQSIDCNFKLNTQIVLAQYATNQAGFFREACYFCTPHRATNDMTILE